MTFQVNDSRAYILKNDKTKDSAEVEIENYNGKTSYTIKIVEGGVSDMILTDNFQLVSDLYDMLGKLVADETERRKNASN